MDPANRAAKHQRRQYVNDLSIFYVPRKTADLASSPKAPAFPPYFGLLAGILTDDITCFLYEKGFRWGLS